MNRFFLGMAAWAIAFAPIARAQSTDDLAKTGANISALQNRDGGFGAKPGDPSSLGTTSSAIRTLKNTGGSIPDVSACVRYVKSCYDGGTGGFAKTPGGSPDVPTTATGLMAVAELKIPADEYASGAIGFFSKNAHSFEEVRIAVAGLEAVGKTASIFEEWTKQVEALRSPDGTVGKGPGQARETGGVAVALLRMGVKLDKREGVLAAIRAGQNADGGWSKGEGPSDLEATYRVMRAFFMLKETPDLDKLRGFIARCRNSDGGYGIRPGAPSELQGAYYATTVIRWVRLLGGEPALVETAGFVPLFNGKDLSGWEGDTSLWSARDGMIVGTSNGLKHNDFLATEKSYGDFVLKLTFRLIGEEGSNSGVQFRSVRIPGHEMSGYQADIGKGYWGSLYDESRRNKVLVQAKPESLKELHTGGWNHYVIRAIGDEIRLSLNGVTTVQYREEDPKIARDGRIALQIHAGGPMVIQFKDLWIQPLARPTEGGDAKAPGFHLRSLSGGGDGRKYTVFVPTGYDDKKAFPVVLFLHGSGERGEDGVRQAQGALGAAIHARPEAFPAIAVFPQAKKTWSADSDDAKAALAALDEVLSTYKVDRDRVILTGLSMGGSGSWSIASASPGRFAAVVPICGRGDTKSAAALKSLPIWTIVGDADQDRTVLNTREMTEALRALGASCRETEYRGVGHNSWDRAYNDPALIDWMLAQKKQ